MMRKILLHFFLVLSAFGAGMGTLAADNVTRCDARWQNLIMETVRQFPRKGGYYTGGRPNGVFAKTAWRGLNDAFKLPQDAMKPVFEQELAQPSFCSSATYAVLIKALTVWDTEGKISRKAWVNMKPYVGIKDELNPEGFGQDDGEGFWGRANANGPGLGVLVEELGAGVSMTAFRGAKSDRNKENADERYQDAKEWSENEIWGKMVPGDFVKIFWDRNDSKGKDDGAIIGCNADKTADQEHGHSVIFCGFSENGDVRYWSSNGPGKVPQEMGYGVASCKRSAIQRIVVTRILWPERFDNAKNMAPHSQNQWLGELNGKKHGTTKELKKYTGIKD